MFALVFSAVSLSACAFTREGVWSFSERSGNIAYDSSGKGRNASIDTNHVIRLDEAPGGGALWFESIAASSRTNTALVSVADFSSVALSNGLSIAAWVWIDTHVSYSPIVMCTDDHEGWNSGFGLFTGEHGVLGCYVHSGIDENAVFGGKLMTNRWNHVAATFDGRYLKLWIDGKNVAGRMLAARDETAVMTGAPLTFGTIGGGNGAIQPFVGAVADVRVWSSALSASSIADVYRLFLGEAVDPNADDDEDGLSNGWEVRFKLDPRNSADASSDMDGDGFSNLREYRLGRNPRVGRSKVSHSIIRSCTVVSP